MLLQCSAVSTTLLEVSGQYRFTNFPYAAFFLQYQNTASGKYMHIADIKTCAHAENFGKLWPVHAR